MNTTREYELEIADLTSRIGAATQSPGSEKVRNAAQEKLSEANAAFARLKHHGDDALRGIGQHGEELWNEFQRKLQALRSFVESRLEQRGEK